MGAVAGELAVAATRSISVAGEFRGARGGGTSDGLEFLRRAGSPGAIFSIHMAAANRSGKSHWMTFTPSLDSRLHRRDPQTIVIRQGLGASTFIHALAFALLLTGGFIYAFVSKWKTEVKKLREVKLK